MKCTDFENVVIEIARCELTDAAAREAVLAHAEFCGRCAGRLAHEQLLSDVASAMVAQDRLRAAPPLVEKMLLAAFREQKISLRQNRRAWFLRAWVAATAVLLLFVVILALRWLEAPRATWMSPPAGSAEPAPQVLAPLYRQLQKPPVREFRTARTVPEMSEVATDFFPLTYDPDPLERGRLVRVQLPRAALAAFGLPVNEDRMEDMVDADFLLDEDGLMQAVRFVE